MINQEMLAKDNEITKALSIIPNSEKFTVVLKGGTSLTKGYQIAERMSEDIDLLFFPITDGITRGDVTRFFKVVRKSFKNKYEVIFENPPGGGSKVQYSCSIKTGDNVEIKVDLRFSEYPISFSKKEIYDFKADGSQVRTKQMFNVADLKRTFFDKIFAFQNKAYTELVKSNKYVKITSQEKALQTTLTQPQIKRLARHAHDITKIYDLIEFTKEDIIRYVEEEKRRHNVSIEGKAWLQRSYVKTQVHNFLIFTSIQKIESWFDSIRNDFINDLDFEEIKSKIEIIQSRIKDVMSV